MRVEAGVRGQALQHEQARYLGEFENREPGDEALPPAAAKAAIHNAR